MTNEPIDGMLRLMPDGKGYEVVGLDTEEGQQLVRTAATGQWIDAKVMKPKVGEMVFFLGPQGLDTARWYGIVCESGFLVMLQSWASHGSTATHWMPIPELPESP